MDFLSKIERNYRNDEKCSSSGLPVETRQTREEKSSNTGKILYKEKKALKARFEGLCACSVEGSEINTLSEQ